MKWHSCRRRAARHAACHLRPCLVLAQHGVCSGGRPPVPTSTAYVTSHLPLRNVLPGPPSSGAGVRKSLRCARPGVLARIWEIRMILQLWLRPMTGRAFDMQAGRQANKHKTGVRRKHSCFQTSAYGLGRALVLLLPCFLFPGAIASLAEPRKRSLDTSQKKCSTDKKKQNAMIRSVNSNFTVHLLLSELDRAALYGAAVPDDLASSQRNARYWPSRPHATHSPLSEYTYRALQAYATRQGPWLAALQAAEQPSPW